MRTLAAIFATLMSVTTGGPLRCPCQLAKLCLPSERPCQAAPAEPAAPTHQCGCKAETTNARRAPADHRPGKRSPGDHTPCQHGPVTDLAAPAAGERLTGDSTGDALTVTPSSFTLVTRPTAVMVGRAGWLESAPSSQALLRYVHSFRC